MENYFFEIPIYRCSYDEYSKDLDVLRAKITNYINPNYNEQSNFEKEIIINEFERKSYSYFYNEVVGWFKLYVLGFQIRGELHFEVDLKNRNRFKKRLNKGIRKKQFEYIGKAFELDIYEEYSSSQIFNLILSQIQELNKEGIYKNRYININIFKNVGKYIDWIDLVKNVNKNRI